MEDFRDKYFETLEALFFATSNLSRREKQDETTLAILDELRAIISDFTIQVDKIQGERKKDWENRIKTLKLVFEHIGAIYIQEIYWRKKLVKEQATILEQAKLIAELQTRVEQLEKMNEL